MGSEYKPKIPYFNPDTSYLRLLPPHTGRQSSDQSVREKFMRLATASARQQMRARRPNSLLSDGTLRMPVKLITYHVAMESRPPLQIDMSGPTATTYSPRNKPLYETNAPAYSFGRKDAEKAGGGRKAWSKLWIRSHTPFTQKTEYELRWPSGSQYEQKSTLGPKQASKPEFPSHSIGVRRNFQSMIARKAEMPAANQYEPDLAKRQVMSRAPAFSMGCKLPNKTWVKTPNVPAPNVYSLQSSLNVAKRSHPAFTMCVQRRSKRHDIGPFATL
ncbi:unnamed protein product [Clavelina lepadiformis]|uniref:Uncharacterized protein n=1 Tax=Clavelina lepadiformis TaxID=159417 RepID=A0ABP0GLG1_CLALP